MWGITSVSPGFIQSATMEPRNSNAMLPRNGSVQLFVLSITYPKTKGETMAASAEPVFMRPLAEPEKLGAISIGIAHIGPIVSSEKKNPKLRQMVTQARSCKNIIGSVATTEQR